MNPQPLRITQSIILRLHLHKHNLPIAIPIWIRIPNKQIRNTPSALLILLRQNLADSRQRLAAKTPRDFDQIFKREGPVDAHSAGLVWSFAGVEGADEMFGGAVGDFYETVVYLGGARRVEGVCVEV